MTVDLTLIVAFLIGSLAVGRLARLVVDDDWPPVVWARGKYVAKVPEPWMELVACSFCVAPWFALVNLGAGWLSINGDGLLDWWWWLPNIWLAMAYVGAMITARDIPAD